MAATSWTAMTNTPMTTVCTRDGTPYRTGPSGLIHVKAAHVTELTARGLVTATATVAGVKQPGVSLTIFTDNDKDHG